MALRIGYVPEHFSTPLHFAATHFSLAADLIAFPSGTGHMVTAIRAGEIDVGIGLTEGWIAGLGKEGVDGDGGYRLVGTYVETPLCVSSSSPLLSSPLLTWCPGWAISTGADRPDIASVSSLAGTKIGVSRIGSGSYVMGYVLADQQGWLSPSQAPYSDEVVLHTFDKLRDAVNDGTADFFMWEHFTSKRFHDEGSIRRVGEIYTPWSSWKIVAATHVLGDDRLRDLFAKLDQGVRYFNENPEESVRHISTQLGYTEADARAWLKTVRFPQRTQGVKEGVVEDCVGILRKAGVLVEGRGMSAGSMTAEV